jgi:AcrR family transcriptional regulator
MPRVAESERPARRQRLIDAAWRCLARGSFADLRVEDVCAEASLSKGSFYGYFETKRDLFYTLVDEDSRLLEEAAAPTGATTRGDSARLLGFARESLRAADDPARAQLRADIWAAVTSDEELQGRLREGIGRRRVALRGSIERAVDDGTLADVPANALAALMLALVDGLALHRRLDSGGFRSENVQRALEMLLAGLVAGPPVAHERTAA